VATIWTDYGTAVIEARRQEFTSYGECVHAAKMFFYDNVKDESMPDDRRRGVLAGGVEFSWRCEGYVR
jgi:hypothetical protein